MFWRARSFWLSAGAVAYVAFAALSLGDAPSPFPSPPSTLLGRGLPWLALLALPAALALIWNLTAPPVRGEDRVDEGARAAARAAAAGTAVLLAALTGPGSPGFVALANLGTGVASMAALVALARLSSLGGLMEPPPSARRLEAAAFASLLWTVAVALPAGRALAPRRAEVLDPVLLDWATVAASLGALGLCLITSFRVRATRRLELGVVERATAALLLSATALLVGVLAAVAGVSSPERVLPFTAVVAAAAITTSAVVREPTAIARGLRVALSVSALAAPVALGAVYVTQAAPRRAGAAVFAACVASAVAGLLAPILGRRFASEGTRWLAALDAATAAAMNPDPDVALEAALGALGAAVGRGRGEDRVLLTGAALFRLSPKEMVTVDRAGYAHVEKAEVPAAIAAFADGEPERILRIEVARAVEVRRPELRPAVAWMEQRGVAAMAVVRDEIEAVALLSIPLRGPERPASLEEVRALRALSDRIGAVIAVSASLARSRAREVSGRSELARLATGVKQLEAARDRDAGRRMALARMLERPARVASYSPAARAAVEQLERLGEAGRPIALLSAPGVDAVAWAALAHLASPRRSGPLAVVDGASSAEHDLAHWRDPELSPLVAAAGGSLVVIDAHALPPDVQSYLGAALPDDVGIVVSLPATVDALAASGRLNERLADRLGDRTVALPTLESRAEDLRALSLEHLARIGIRLGKQPLGLAPRALEALLEHTWPGNDAELHATLLRASLVAEGEVLGLKELKSIGFVRGR
jgi:DNA-binding transcriptional regulator YdaS (Cro superfamily)